MTFTEVLTNSNDYTNEDSVGYANGYGDGYSIEENPVLGEMIADGFATGTWTDQALCRTAPGGAGLFFSEELAEIAAAKRICAECPVIAPCLEGALDRAEPCGVWGGQLFQSGVVIAQKRRRGRPPKVARPEDQLPAVPVPEYLQKRVA